MRDSVSWIEGLPEMIGLDEVALNHLTLGRCMLYRVVLAQVRPESSKLETENPCVHLGTAVNGLLCAQDHLPCGLISRAWLCFLGGDAVGARADLDEAWQIAERGPMRLHMADIHLHRARLFFREKPYPWVSPQADLAAARQLIEHCGYWHRKEELEDAEKLIGR